MVVRQTTQTKTDWDFLNVPKEVSSILEAAPNVVVATSTEQLAQMAISKTNAAGFHEVAYDVPGKGRVVESYVSKVRNGILVNCPEPYMRRRDPECTYIGDELPTDKVRFKDKFKKDFESVRQDTFEWLKKQELCVFPFMAGQPGMGVEAIVVAPANAGYFAFGLALLQGMISPEQVSKNFNPRAVIYVAPPFRHTHFDGKQVVVHNRLKEMHELFSYNLYPGPSAKKGVYGILLTLGEKEKWVTNHCSAVQVITPYENTVTFMHEGASGSGKSEMLEHIHRQDDGSLWFAHNTVTNDNSYLVLPKTCELHPVTDDMALAHPSLQGSDKKLSLVDAENSWFIRVNHIKHYGTDPHLEKITLNPPKPLLFMNFDAVPGSRALIWEHIEDAPGKPCPNPRVVVPRELVPEIVTGPVTIDIRSFGVRTPPCTRKKPSYGIIGLFHILPPALAWIWRLVAPRGYNNPSIVGGSDLESEGVGSYWPFATGRKVDQANLLLKQIMSTTRTGYILIPNQHIGAWKVGFMPQWITREYLARRGNLNFKPERLEEARSSLLGYVPKSLIFEGQSIENWFLKVHEQAEVGEEAYDAGAKMLTDFFREELKAFLVPELDPLGKKIIECFMNGGTVSDYAKLIPSEK
jgi:hypothetical protein